MFKVGINIKIKITCIFYNTIKQLYIHFIFLILTSTYYQLLTKYLKMLMKKKSGNFINFFVITIYEEASCINLFRFFRFLI